MRVKSDARRQAILDIATELFREIGYERASMAMISARLGGSKATLYNYFRSKEELFAAAMLEAVTDRGQQVVELLDPGRDDVRAVLLAFGKGFLNLVTAPETMDITRTAVAEGTRAALGPELYANGPRLGWLVMLDYVRALQERGKLPAGDAGIMAAHLQGLLQAGIVEPMMYGAAPELNVDQAVEAAVDAFLRAYPVADGN